MASRNIICLALLLCLSAGALAEDPYLYFEWNVAYGTISPLGVPQKGILINGQFPGPMINCTSNNNIIVNVFNHLDEPFLLTWSGIQQRKNSWQDGTLGTMCPIMPGKNYTYKFQVKDQIGTYFYYPTTGLHKAAGGMGMIKVHSRELIPVPFNRPEEEFAVLLGDWYNKGHKALKATLDGGRSIGFPDGIQINGNSGKVGVAQPLFTMDSGKTYRYRVCNVGLRTSVNFRFQGHTMKLVEVEGSHTVQNTYDSLDLHAGQCLSVLVTADQTPKDYYLVVSGRFVSKKHLESVAIVRYSNGKGPASPELPPPPPNNTAGVAWSMNQFRSFRWNLTASAARPNPQGSYHYGQINITRTIKLVNARYQKGGKLRFGINGISHVDGDTPLKLAEYFHATENVFNYDLVKDEPSPAAAAGKVELAPSVVNATFRNFVEIIFENGENSIQTWHLDGHSFFAVAVEAGKWGPEKRKSYNLLDAVSRHTVQVYPKSWAAVMTTLDNAGMWNLRSMMQERAHLGQQLYFSVLSPERSLRDEYSLPETQLLCGVVEKMPKPAPYV